MRSRRSPAPTNSPTPQALWRQRFGTAPANERDKARQVRFLQARGYGLSVALRVLRAAGHRGDDDT